MFNLTALRVCMTLLVPSEFNRWKVRIDESTVNYCTDITGADPIFLTGGAPDGALGM